MHVGAETISWLKESTEMYQQPMVGFGDAIGRGLGRGLKNFLNFRGRATRAEFWWFVLVLCLLSIGLGLQPSVTGNDLQANTQHGAH